MGQFLCRPRSNNTKKNIANPPTTQHFCANFNSKRESLYGSPYPNVEETASGTSSSTCTIDSPDLYKSYTNPHSPTRQDITHSICSRRNDFYSTEHDVNRYSIFPTTSSKVPVHRKPRSNARASISDKNSPYTPSAPHTSRNSFSSVSRLQALSYEDAVAADPPRLVGPRYLDHHEPFTVFPNPKPQSSNTRPATDTAQHLEYVTKPTSNPATTGFCHNISGGSIPHGVDLRAWNQEQGENYKGYTIMKREIVTNDGYEINSRGKPSSIRSNFIGSIRPNTSRPAHGLPPCLSISIPTGKERHVRGHNYSGDVYGHVSTVYGSTKQPQSSTLNRQPPNNNEMYANYGYPLIYHGQNHRPNPTYALKNHSNIAELPCLAENAGSKSLQEARVLTYAHQAIDDTILPSAPHTQLSRSRPTTRTRPLPSGRSGLQDHVDPRSKDNLPGNHRYSMYPTRNPDVSFGTVTSNIPSSSTSPVHNSLQASVHLEDSPPYQKSIVRKAASMSNLAIPSRTSSVAQGSSNVRSLNTSTSGTARPKPKDQTGNEKQQQWIAREANEPLSLDGIVDLTNTVDTDVTTKILPAVTHEHITPTVHEIRQEVITREIHKHDVFHRVLPIIETEILPTKHYVASADGKTLKEIPAHMVPGRTMDGSPNRNWEIKETAMGKGDHGSIFQPPHSLKHKPSSSTLSTDSWSSARSGFASDSSDFSTSASKGKEAAPLASKIPENQNLSDPILSSKKEYISKEGHPKTEYVWRHPPVFETANGKTQPIDYEAERSVKASRHSTGTSKKYSYIPRSAQGDVPEPNRVIWSTNDRQVSNEQGRAKEHRRRSLEGQNRTLVSDVAVEHTDKGGLVADVERGMADLKVKN